MDPLFRLPLTVALAFALLVAPAGLVAADEAEGATSTETTVIAAEPKASATDDEADPDCGCGARSPGQLLETQQEVNEAITAEPGS